MSPAYHVVLAVQTLRAPLRGVLGESRCARVWTAARDVIFRTRAIPPQDSLEEFTMTTSTLAFSNCANALSGGLSLEAVQQRAPAVFALSPHERMSSKYTFIPTERVLSSLMQVGFVAVDARQARTRAGGELHARHAIRLRRRYETVQLMDSVPEVVFLNSHDGTSAYQFRMGIYRAVCTNGLIVSRGAFPACYVSHRGNVVEDVVAAALQVAERFESLAAQVERMEHRRMFKDEQLAFAGQALTLRFPDAAQAGLRAVQLLGCRRVQDAGDDLWSVLNKVQENLLGGGLVRYSLNGRLTRTRRITSIREDVRLNSRLWDLASEVMAA